MSHPVVHFEIVGKDGEALKRFYGDVFGWAIDSSNPMNYGIVERLDGGIGGGICDAQPDEGSRVTIYIQADDVAGALASAEAAGATRVMGPEQVPGGPEIALFTDPQGNLVGLVKGM